MRSTSNTGAAFWLGLLLAAGLVGAAWYASNSAIKVKEYERSVTAKGLSEREYMADIVIWPIQFVTAENELGALYQELERSVTEIRSFLTNQGIADGDVSVGPPAITDKVAQQWGGDTQIRFRYSATQTVTVYSEDIDAVRAAMGSMTDLGKQGLVINADDYGNATEYLFTRLNEVKPEMIEEATRNAREVATKFAQDSNSRLGKIRRASQGQFSIEPRDRNNPHIKKIRVVSTVEYYLSD